MFKKLNEEGRKLEKELTHVTGEVKRVILILSLLLDI